MSKKVISQTSRVRALYKAILKIHRGLPLQMKALGDQYAKEEFRLHKDAPPEQAKVFMAEWTIKALRDQYAKEEFRLHKDAPPEQTKVFMAEWTMKALGDQYVKEEFRLHKDAPPEQAKVFMVEWTKYYLTMARQIGAKKPRQEYGQNLSPELIDCFNDEQVSQVYELFQETKKPLVEEES